ncbi:hypothetical protein IW150_004175 [Coemansia sp. RSA 2607]|nr:hypothetical protein IW150_004175 [Coemansia sp. RSA 2607]KAJ2392225.1 hypothetical protein GGI05_002724 [Coemansia sp. RSA 2603]
MNVFHPLVSDPTSTTSPSSNNSTNGHDLFVATAAQETAIQVAATFIQNQQHEVVVRLMRYRDYYTAEIERQNERIVEINHAMATFGQNAGASDSKRRAMEVLSASLVDAKRCIDDAQLAKTRLELELAQWGSSTKNSGDDL